MNYSESCILLFATLTCLTNLIVCLVSRLKPNPREFEVLLIYWASILVALGAIFFFHEDSTQIALASYFFAAPSFIKAKILRDARGMKSHWGALIAIHVVAFLTTAAIAYFTLSSLDLMILPLIIATACLYTAPAWECLVKNPSHSNWVEKTYAAVLMAALFGQSCCILFGLNRNSGHWAWAIVFANFQAISLLYPLLINQRREQTEQWNLKNAIEKITGKNTQGIKENDLYFQLQLSIAEHGAFAQKLQTSHRSLEEERELNEILIRTLSHDLANPLTIINAYSELLHHNKIDPSEVDKIWERLKINTRSALDMIHRIRNAITTRNHASLVTIQPVSVERAISHVIEMFEMQLKEKNLRISYKNNLNDNTPVCAEETSLIEHVLSNILSNAIKFSYAHSEIFINVSEHSDSVKIEFKDCGVGIENYQFEKKLLQSTLGTNGETGSGFGIMVLGYFIRQFKGSWNIISNTNGPDQGTTVVVTLKKYRPELANAVS